MLVSLFQLSKWHFQLASLNFANSKCKILHDASSLVPFFEKVALINLFSNRLSIFSAIELNQKEEYLLNSNRLVLRHRRYRRIGSLFPRRH